MRSGNIDLNLFVVLDAIYTERNLTRAADVLCLTQPSVSNALSRLRKSFNDELFVRTPQGMMPTPFTENVIGRVRDALQLLDSSVQESDSFDPLHSERAFRLSMNDVTESAVLPDLLQQLGRQAPGISVESYFTRRRELSLALSSGQLAMAIDIPEAADKNVCHVPLFRERYVCAVRPGHPVAGSALTLDRYLALEHLHVSSRRMGRGVVDVELNRLGCRRSIKLRLQHYLVAPDVIRQTDLVMTVPSHWARRTGLEILELPLALPVQESHLLWHKSADGDQAHHWLRERIISLYES